LQGTVYARDEEGFGTSGVVYVSESNLNQWLKMEDLISQIHETNYLAKLTIGFPMTSEDGFVGTMYVDDVRISPP
jgi:hypothetical protein